MKHKEGHILIAGDKRFVDIQVKTLELIAETGGEFKRIAIDEQNIRSITQQIPNDQTPAADIYSKKGRMNRYVISSNYGCGKITLKNEGGIIIHEAQHGEDYRKRKHLFKQGVGAIERPAYERENEWRAHHGLPTRDVDAIIRGIILEEKLNPPPSFKEQVFDLTYQLIMRFGERLIRTIPAPTNNEIYPIIRSLYGAKRK